MRMQPCCAAARQKRIGFRSGRTFRPARPSPDGTTRPPGESPAQPRLRAQALTAGSVSGRRRSGTDETGRGAGPRSTAAPDAKETRRQSSRASETSAHASATRRYGKTIKKKGRERPDIPFLSASRAFIRKVSLRPSPSTVVCDRLRRRSPR